MLLRIEIVIFFISFGYIVYYIAQAVYSLYHTQKTKEEERQKKREEISQQIQKKHKDSVQADASENLNKKRKLSDEDAEKLKEILKRVELNKSRGYLDDARALIIEGLSINKYHKGLNLHLADTYEIEEKYQNAEFIFKDLLKEYKNNFEILVRLGQNLYAQDKVLKAIDAYKKAVHIKRDDLDVIELLAGLSFDIKNFQDALKYSKLYLKQKPRNPEMLGIKGYCLEKEGKLADAIECYTKILDIQPYNAEMKDRIAILEQKV